MKHILVSLALTLSLAACSSNDVCEGDHCVCTAADDCSHDCSSGGEECHIQCAAGSCDVGCAAGENCHVECSQSTSCMVDCQGALDCHVTCPSGNCTVLNCPANDCSVTCGLTGIATMNGSTATCP